MNLESAFFVVEAIAELDTGAGITAAEVAVGVRMSAYDGSSSFRSRR